MGRPTVTIKTDQGPVTINESAYDKDKHTLYVVDPDPSDEENLDYKKQTVGWLKKQLTIKGTNFDGVSKKTDLITLYEMTHD